MFILRPIVAADAELDHDAVMETRELLRKWSQSTWPEDDFTIEANRKDMVTMERRHTDHEAFGYTMMNLEQSECFGCVYIFPPDANWFSDVNVAEVGGHQWSACDAMLFFWVRASKLAESMGRLLLDSLTNWLEQEWSFKAPVLMTNEQFAQQVATMEASNLRLRFEIELADDPGSYLAYG